MLVQISIIDFAIVERLDIHFDEGMTVLTGETGAGKSILVDALMLLLGARARADSVRPGAQRAEISAVFDLADCSPAQRWLSDRELDDESGECIVRRTLNVDGRSRTYVNGRPLPVQDCREIGDFLVDIHGQHGHHRLLKRENQLELVDQFGGHAELLLRVGDLARRWRATTRELAELDRGETDREARLDLLRYQVDELEALAVEPGEVESLFEEQRRLSNVESILSACFGAAAELDDDDSGGAIAALARAARQLEPLKEFDRNVVEAVELVEASILNATEANNALRTVTDRTHVDGDALREIELRLERIHDLARKHRVAPERLHDHLADLRGEIAEFESSAARALELGTAQDDLLTEYSQLGGQLHELRVGAAAALEEQVTGQMQLLGMTGGVFQIALEPQAQAEPSPTGNDRLEFLVSANPGLPVRPLAKVASGGELSRISLAVQVCATQDASVPTLIFDEVDVGIGGRVAEIVGRHLRSLAENRQVFCVTHQAQVAAQAHHHARVMKTTDAAVTTTVVEIVQDAQRIEEIARMVGGERITDRTLAHAKEMLDGA